MKENVVDQKLLDKHYINVLSSWLNKSIDEINVAIEDFIEYYSLFFTDYKIAAKYFTVFLINKGFFNDIKLARNINTVFYNVNITTFVTVVEKSFKNKISERLNTKEDYPVDTI